MKFNPLFISNMPGEVFPAPSKIGNSTFLFTDVLKILCSSESVKSEPEETQLPVISEDQADIILKQLTGKTTILPLGTPGINKDQILELPVEQTNETTQSTIKDNPDSELPVKTKNPEETDIYACNIFPLTENPLVQLLSVNQTPEVKVEPQAIKITDETQIDALNTVKQEVKNPGLVNSDTSEKLTPGIRMQKPYLFLKKLEGIIEEGSKLNDVIKGNLKKYFPELNTEPKEAANIVSDAANTVTKDVSFSEEMASEVTHSKINVPEKLVFEDSKLSEKTIVPEKSIAAEKIIVPEKSMVIEKSVVSEKETVSKKTAVSDKGTVSEKTTVSEKFPLPETREPADKDVKFLKNTADTEDYTAVTEKTVVDDLSKDLTRETKLSEIDIKNKPVEMKAAVDNPEVASEILIPEIKKSDIKEYAVSDKTPLSKIKNLTQEISSAPEIKVIQKNIEKDSQQNSTDKKSDSQPEPVRENFIQVIKETPLKQESVLESVNKLSHVTEKNPGTVKEVHLHKVVPEVNKIISEASQTSTVKLKIMPEGLGSLKIEMTIKQNNISANIEVDNESVKNIIQNNNTELKQTLNQNGLNLQSLNVQLTGEQQRQKNFYNKKTKTKVSAPVIKESEINPVGIHNYSTYEYLA